LIKSVEILFISSSPDLIEEFNEISSKIYEYFNLKWNDKIERWKKRIDCEYDWDCKNCPYIEACDEIKNVLEQRNRINNY
jgi:Zn-finger protein